MRAVDDRFQPEPRNEQSRSGVGATRRRVVVVGGGIAGAEAALTMALGLRDADVLLIGAWPSIRLLPDLVYVPVGVAPHRLDIPLEDLAPHGVRCMVAHVERVDLAQRRVHTSAGVVPFDVLIAAPGAMVARGPVPGLRSLADALRVRDGLEALAADAEQGYRGTITIHAAGDDSWTAPACELAILIGAWARARRIEHRIDTMLVTTDREACEWFGPAAGDVVDAALRRARVHVATGVDTAAFDELGGDLVIDVGSLEPRTIAGLPGRGPHGWYEVDEHGAVAPGVYVIGDAAQLPFRAGFATAWQARRVLRALGGDIAALGPTIDGIPNQAVEYQMDLADGVLRARMTNADRLAHPFLGHDVDIEVVPGGRPDKLLGLLLHDRVLRWRARDVDAPLAFRDVLLAHATSRHADGEHGNVAG